MTLYNLEETYFDYLCNIVCGRRFSSEISFRKLLLYLHHTEFRYCHPMDKNRATDGVDMRYHFAIAQGYEDSPDFILECLDGPCSMLEMMIALAMRCESIMDDPSVGDRTAQWFWEMITNLGLGSMMDNRFDIDRTQFIIDRFLNREYEPDGRGSLVRLRNGNIDLREHDIWYQLCHYLGNYI